MECSINLSELFETAIERIKLDHKWEDFINSDPSNEEIYHLNIPIRILYFPKSAETCYLGQDFWDVKNVRYPNHIGKFGIVSFVCAPGKTSQVLKGIISVVLFSYGAWIE